MKIAVQLAESDIVRTVRSLADNPSDATHPVYNVSRSLGTGKATCRACNNLIEENERTLLFQFAPHEQDHEHHYRRVRMVIHEDDCSQSGEKMINCPLPSCQTSIPKEQWSKHWQNHNIGSGWVMKKPASVQICAKHSLAHCGQCEEDRELEEPKLDERVPTIKKKEVKSSENLEWRHTEEDGFEMWETKEDPNKFAIIENGDKYDLYYLKDSYSSTEEAKAAAESMQKIAQDGGGTGGAGAGSGGGDGSSGGASSSGASSPGSGEGSGISTSGESADSSDNESSEASIVNQDSDEDPRPPSDEIKDCPKCKSSMQETQLLNNVRGFICGSCGYTYKKRKPKKSPTTSSWVNNLIDINSLKSTTEQTNESDITPRIPPALLPQAEAIVEPKAAIDLFKLQKAAYRSVTCQRCGKTYRTNKKGHFTGFCETCKEKLGIVNHQWNSQDAQRGHSG